MIFFIAPDQVVTSNLFFILAIFVRAFIKSIEARGGRHIDQHFRRLPHMDAGGVDSNLSIPTNGFHAILKTHAITIGTVAISNGFGPSGL